MSHHLKIWVALLTLSLALPVLSWSQAASKTPAKPPQPETDQTTNIPYFTLRGGMDSTLTLQNLAPKPTPVTVTIST